MTFRLVLFLSLLATTALAVEPDEILPDVVMEERAREISKELRCLVCQNQSIDDSDAPLARDLRLLVRERLLAGDTDEETVSFIVDRYGDFVLLRPPFKASTLILWVGPALLLISGMIGVGIWHRRRPANEASESVAPLTAEEQDRVKKLMSREKES
ncbi:MAG: Cytochrome c-type biogenesis protein CcmH [Alphaproteobacteria bacterium MarineAlpha11_Bin1]|nr:MAG: Cytochrome c-type biogenesis protein CcmH [Alphaproteobacteria bacterium MarineAlpha11_Bin1]|tara:strand:- start:4105 stop:4575 length:471 start_codon:yes stop_codon:yes gene_type:complete